MGEFAFPGISVLGMNSHSQWLANGKFGKHEIHFVIGVDFIVVGWVAKGKGQHALLLQIGFMLQKR